MYLDPDATTSEHIIDVVNMIAEIDAVLRSMSNRDYTLVVSHNNDRVSFDDTHDVYQDVRNVMYNERMSLIKLLRKLVEKM